jgi:SAM-dependent methyltransferase
MNTRDQILRRLNVSSTDFVIDIGGGHRPFWRADLVIEKYPFDHSLHRNQPMQFGRVPVIKADALAIPIPDGGCDLIFASHIIEHLPDPVRFIAEIKRCSQRVYLEFPSRNRELMFAWSFHEWLIEPAGRVLRFYRNDLPQLFGRLFHEEYDAALGAWSEARHEHLNTSMYCRSDELDFEFPTETATEMLLRSSPRGTSKINSAEFIHRSRYSPREVLAFAAQSMLPGSVYARLSRQRGGSSSPAPFPDSVLARLMCLHCRAVALRRSKDTITCQCGAQYLQDRGVFDFDPQDQ